MRVLFVTNMYPPHHLGGYELSCRDVVERFHRRGHEVTVLTTKYHRPGVEDGDRGRDIRRLLEFYWRDYGPWYKQFGSEPGGREVLRIEHESSRILRHVVRDVRPDVLSLWNLGACPWSLVTTAIRSRIPIVHHTCNLWPALNLEDPFVSFRERRPVASRVAAAVLRIPTKLPDLGRSGTFCWVSQATWTAVEEATPWTFPRSKVVHSGISHEDFPPVPPPEAPRRWNGRLLFVGRLEESKGVETVIDAVAKSGDVTAEVIGWGRDDYLATLRTRAADLGVADRIVISGKPRSELRDCYQRADVLLFTSVHEPFGLVPIEAMACGTPVIASGVDGSHEFLADERNCLLYTDGDAESLAAAIQRLAGDGDLRLSLVRGGLETAEEYTVDRLADRLEEAHIAEIARARGDQVPARSMPELAVTDQPITPA